MGGSLVLLVLVVMGVLFDDPVQVEGASSDFNGSVVGEIKAGSWGSLVTSALLVKPINALDGMSMELNETGVGSFNGRLDSSVFSWMGG